MLTRLLPAALAACLLATAAVAQNAPSTRIRGTIAALNDQTLTVATREGPKVDVMLDDKLTVGSLKRVDLADIKPGAYVGIATRTVGGEQQAIAVFVFPDASRGVGEGHYPWDLEPGSMMTNGTVTGTVDAKSGEELSLSFKGDSNKIVVAAWRADRDLSPSRQGRPQAGREGVLRGDEERGRQARDKPRHRREGWGCAADVARAAGAMERVKGIEPSYAAWEAAVLPLNYTRAARCPVSTPVSDDGAIRDTLTRQRPMPGSFRPDVTLPALWTDRPNPLRALAATGHIIQMDADQSAHCAEHGWLLMERAIEPELVDALVNDIRNLHEHPGDFATTHAPRPHASQNHALPQPGVAEQGARLPAIAVADDQLPSMAPGHRLCGGGHREHAGRHLARAAGYRGSQRRTGILRPRPSPASLNLRQQRQAQRR